jgi:hypothetical protein
VSVLLSGPASADAKVAAFDHTATLSNQNATLTLSGHVTCDVGPRITMHLWFQEGPHGTSGTWTGTCPGSSRTFAAVLPARDVVEGVGRATALASGAGGTIAWKQSGIRVIVREAPAPKKAGKRS